MSLHEHPLQKGHAQAARAYSEDSETVGNAPARGTAPVAAPSVAASTTDRHQGTQRGRGPSAGVRWIRGIALFVVGFVLYWLCDLLLMKPLGALLSWLIVIAMAVLALVVWLVDEHRQNDADSVAANADVHDSGQ